MQRAPATLPEARGLRAAVRGAAPDAAAQPPPPAYSFRVPLSWEPVAGGACSGDRDQPSRTGCCCSCSPRLHARVRPPPPPPPPPAADAYAVEWGTHSTLGAWTGAAHVVPDAAQGLLPGGAWAPVPALGLEAGSDDAAGAAAVRPPAAFAAWELQHTSTSRPRRPSSLTRVLCSRARSSSSASSRSRCGRRRQPPPR